MFLEHVIQYKKICLARGRQHVIMEYHKRAKKIIHAQVAEVTPCRGW
jgi:hypothetical protein